jgi:hypothetical protein
MTLLTTWTEYFDLHLLSLIIDPGYLISFIAALT